MATKYNKLRGIWETEREIDLALYQPLAARGAVNGYAPLSSSSLIVPAYLGTGSASAATVLRGNSTYAAGVSGGWSSTHLDMAEQAAALDNPSSGYLRVYNLNGALVGRTPAGSTTIYGAGGGSGGDDWQFLGETLAASSATIDLSFTGGYDDYRVEVYDLLPATDSEYLLARLSQSSAFLTGATDYIWHTAGESISSVQTRTTLAGGAEIYITPQNTSWQIGNVASPAEGVHFLIAEICDVTQSSYKKLLEGHAIYIFDAGTVGRTRFSGYIRANNLPIDGLRFYMSAGAIASGRFRLFGRNRL